MTCQRSTKKVMEWVFRATEGGLHFTQAIHKHSLWLERSCALQLRAALTEFLAGYCRLAQYCVVKRKTLFGLTPKLHALCHFRQDLDCSLAAGHDKILNPGVWDCSQNEDYIGKVSRQSRRVAYKRKTFEAQILKIYLLKTRFVITKFRADQSKKAAR